VRRNIGTCLKNTMRAQNRFCGKKKADVHNVFVLENRTGGSTDMGSKDVDGGEEEN
jgi:hypothetical protein